MANLFAAPGETEIDCQWVPHYLGFWLLFVSEVDIPFSFSDDK